MALDSKEYWKKRSDERLVASELIGRKTMQQTAKIYNEALRAIEKDIQSVYANYSIKGIVEPALLKKALNPLEKRRFLDAISINSLRLGIDPKEVFDERYLSRLSRLDAIKKQIEIEIMGIAPQVEVISTKNYTEIISTAYENSQTDLQERGFDVSFETLDRSVVKEIVKSKWAKGNYSTRIWGNSGRLSQELPTLMGGALSSGQSYAKTARVLRDSFNTTKYEATRLVVTETNYFHNQSELQSYVDDGIQRYEYLATMDNRTSLFCRQHDGKAYNVKDAVVGENYPPGHPWCRSTTVVLFDGEQARTPERKERVARLTPFDDGTTKGYWKEKIST